MSNHDYQQQLSHERATNEHYIKVQLQNQIRRRELADDVVTTRSASWTDTAPRIGKINQRIRLIGRVALTTDDEDLGADYYIGDRYLEQTSMNVDSCTISWAAPAASIFYQGNNSKEAVPDPSTLAATRRFTSSSTDQIIDYQDEIEDGVDQTDVFLLPMPIEIPPAPSTGVTQAPPARALEDESEAKDRPEAEDMTDVTPTVSHNIPDSSIQIRAERLVNASLDAPRTGQLPSALSTLQPDQYQFVTWPADTPLLLQGGPGTGKTVIAAYRALYLTHPENRERRAEKLALVGPTQVWAHHVGSLLNDMEVPDVTCISLEDLIWNAAQGPRHALHHSKLSWFKVDWAIYRLTSRAVKQLQQEGLLDPNKGRAMKQVLETLINDTSIHRRVTDGEHSQWLLSIPNYSQARKWPDCLLLFAAISIALEQANPKPQSYFPFNHYDHIIVDEAQDVRGVEWAILDQIIAQNGTWTIIGDMNQRRADYTFGSWRELIDQLETGDAYIDKEEVLTTGYRSTRQIMKFASSLVDQPSEWKVNMLRDGSDVVIERTSIKKLSTKVMVHIDNLTTKYSKGTVAIIGINLKDIERHVIRAGWRREKASPLLNKDRGQKLMLADPIKARGLEFDAVIVVEPADFPTNLGRSGPLYTSLTRAHQELIVVHTKQLPEKLRNRARRLQ